MSGCPFHLADLHGPQGVTEDDRVYWGSRFSEVKSAILDNPYQEVWGGPGNGAFPNFESTTRNAFAGFLSGKKRDQLLLAATRAVDSRVDLRWGSDRCGYRRILHPNGICLIGRWEITEENPYSGYFRPGSVGLMIARLSPHGSATQRGQSRSLGLVGKIYPTTDENHADPLYPANFFTQQDLGGARTEYLNDAEFRNEPDVTLWRRGLQIPVLARSGLVFGKVDRVADTRQLHEIAELEKPDGEATNAPKYLVLKMADGQPRIPDGNLDFRDEVYAHVYDAGATTPSRTLSFDIKVSNQATVRGFAAFKRVHVTDPRRIGRIVFDDVVASYNGDHVIHFHHPNWRKDQNEPSTAVSR